MKIVREELETRIDREIENFYNYLYTPGEISRKRTAFYFLTEDFVIFEKEGGDLINFKETFLVKKLKEKTLKSEQEDFIIDLLDFIDKNFGNKGFILEE